MKSLIDKPLLTAKGPTFEGEYRLTFETALSTSDAVARAFEEHVRLGRCIRRGVGRIQGREVSDVTFGGTLGPARRGRDTAPAALRTARPGARSGTRVRALAASQPGDATLRVCGADADAQGPCTRAGREPGAAPGPFHSHAGPMRSFDGIRSIRRVGTELRPCLPSWRNVVGRRTTAPSRVTGHGISGCSVCAQGSLGSLSLRNGCETRQSSRGVPSRGRAVSESRRLLAQRLRAVDPELLEDAVARIPERRMSEWSRLFASAMLRANRENLQGVRFS